MLQYLQLLRTLGQLQSFLCLHHKTRPHSVLKGLKHSLNGTGNIHALVHGTAWFKQSHCFAIVLAERAGDFTIASLFPASGEPILCLGLFAGGYLPIDKQEGPEAQYSYYKQTYDAAQASLQGNTGLKGIMFWRWAGVDPTAVLANFDEAATIGAYSTRSPWRSEQI